MLVIPDKMFRHPENKDAVLDILDEFFKTDVFVGDSQTELISRVKEVLKDEPEIYEEYVVSEL